VETLPFDGAIREDRPTDGQPGAKTSASPENRPWYLKKDPKIIGGAAAGGVVLIGAIVWLAMRGRRKRVDFTEQVAQLAPAAPRLISGEATPENAAAKESAVHEDKLIESLKAPMLSATKSEALTKYLRQEVHKDPVAATQLLRTWLLDEEG
jgi:flagellar biosynthesis/type III secretory pathway M-ring protein FliF/YscJ